MREDDFDELLAGRGGLGYEQLDDLARVVQGLLVETATEQITRPLAREFDVRVDQEAPERPRPPEGYRLPARGVVCIGVRATSRTVASVSADLDVLVWTAMGGSPVSDLLVERAGTDHRLGIDLSEVHPQPTPALRGRLNDFVAREIASVVTELNVGMQRSIGRLPRPDEDDDEN